MFNKHQHHEESGKTSTHMKKHSDPSIPAHFRPLRAVSYVSVSAFECCELCAACHCMVITKSQSPEVPRESQGSPKGVSRESVESPSSTAKKTGSLIWSFTCKHRFFKKWFTYPIHMSSNGDGSKPWYLVNPKIAGKWMFIPLKMYL